MSAELSIGAPRDERELAAFVEIACESLGVPPTDEYDWPQKCGPENLRLARRGGQVLGGLGLLHFGQWFGGRSVPMTGVSLVAVAPQHRSSGVAGALLRSALAEMRDAGTPLSGLYPATQPVYRKAGFEQAGVRIQYGVTLDRLDIRDRELGVRAFEPSERARIRTVQRTFAQRSNGLLDRIEWNWNRVEEPRHGTAYGYIFGDPGEVEGYLFFTQRKHESFGYDLFATDVVALTPRAVRRIWTFLADHRSVAGKFQFCGAPADPMLYALTEQSYEIELRIDWMSRIVDVRAALEARGYPAGVATKLHLDVYDDVLEQNTGKFVLDVCEKKGRARPGGRGDLRVDIRGLATLYTGHLSARELLATDRVSGTDAAIEAASAIFAGPSPWLSENY